MATVNDLVAAVADLKRAEADNARLRAVLNDAADYIDELEKNLRTITRIAAEIKIDSHKR